MINKITAPENSAVTYRITDTNGDTVQSGFADYAGDGAYTISVPDAPGELVVYVGGDEYERVELT